MLYVFPAVFVVLGVSFGCLLWYGAHRAGRKLRRVADARTWAPGVSGLVKVRGAARAEDPAGVLISPLEQRRCVYYRLVIEHFQSKSSNANTPGVKTVGGGSWVPVIEDEQAVPTVLTADGGAVGVDPRVAQVDFPPRRWHANLLTGLPAGVEESIRERYKLVTKTWFVPKQMRYTEVVIPEGADVFAVGDCEERNGRAELNGAGEPVLLTHRTERQVRRTGGITLAVMRALGVVFPVGFVTAAYFIYTSSAAAFGPQPQQPATRAADAKPSAKPADPIDTAVTRFKGAQELTDRARAARALPELKADDERVDEVAPLLNPLLESKDVFHRDGALHAIQRGWGTVVNGPALRKLHRETNDARRQKDITAAIDRLKN